MMPTLSGMNAAEAATSATLRSALSQAAEAFRSIVRRRLAAHFGGESLADFDGWIEATHGSRWMSNELADMLPEIQSHEEWVVLFAALAPHIVPGFFEPLIMEAMPSGGDFAEFGGVKGTGTRAMLPTGETALFLLGGTDISARLQAQELFREEHHFHRASILWIEPVREGEPPMSGRLILSTEWAEKLLTGREATPRFGLDFPARRVTTAMTWEDAVLHPRTRKQVADIGTWLAHRDALLSDKNLGRRLKPGYRVLFYGPSGTGKTMTAALLGKEHNRDVYRVDLSQVVSKYIGETEKNLEGVFRRAEGRDWILFFDEADALFGKRTGVQSAHDKYANQEVSYLLQRVEEYAGLLVLASNFKSNLDDAFLRRFHAVVHFPMPAAVERKMLWDKSLPSGLILNESVNLRELAEAHELTGASILNAVQYGTLQAYARGDRTLRYEDLAEGVRKELMKEEK